jgi:hypothetical protein
MNIKAQEPPRQFEVGTSGITLSHCADIELAPDELVTFVTSGGAEYDVTRKSWGYYATPSIDGRLADNGFRAALVQNVDTQQRFVVIVDKSRVDEWHEYNRLQRLQILMWLDNNERRLALEAHELLDAPIEMTARSAAVQIIQKKSLSNNLASDGVSESAEQQ